MSAPLLAAECIAFKSEKSGKFVSYTREPKKKLQVSGDNTKTPYTRFHPEPSSKHDGYYHIKSLYNNKYWVVHGSYICVDANEPEEDLSRPYCTLFRIEQVLHGNNSFCMISHGGHMLRGGGDGSVSIDTSGDDSLSGSLLLGRDAAAFKLISMASKIMLPNYVCFKGDNGKYLKERMKRGHLNFMEFAASDKHDPHAFHTIQTNEDGTVCVYNDKVERWWRLSPAWIWADYYSSAHGDPSSRRDTTFLPCKFGDDKVGLKCLGNNKFCKRLTDYWADCLNACGDTITDEAVLVVEEPLLSRRIYKLKYHFEDARVYDKEIIYASTVSDVNRTSEAREHEIPIEYTVMDERRWDSSTSWKLGAQLTIEGGIPIIGAELQLQIQGEYGRSHTWGATHQEEVKSTYIFKGQVGAHKKVTVQLQIYRAACDIPFSYWQDDVWANGKELINQQFDDGIFHGVNMYKVTHEVTEEDIE